MNDTWEYGTWKYIGNALRCSNCGVKIVLPKPIDDLESVMKSMEFCPRCHADMRSGEEKEEDLIERIADRVIQKLKDEKAEEERCKRELEFLNNIEHIHCDELPETGASGCIYCYDGKGYTWLDGRWQRVE